MDNGTLYSTIATINGVWISLLFSLGLVLLTHIVNQNMVYFTSLRAEKKTILDNYTNLTSMMNLGEHIGEYDSYEDDYVNGKLSLCLDYITSEYDVGSKNRLKTNVVKPMQDCIQQIVSCYPHPGKPNITFGYSSKSSGFNKVYAEWAKKYLKRINFNDVEKAFDIIYATISDYFIRYGETPADRLGIRQIESVRESLTNIDNSILHIRQLQIDYLPIIIIKKQVRPILYSIAVILIFGVFLPIYMLQPYRLNVLSEGDTIGLIFIPTAILYAYVFYKINMIRKVIIA